MVDGASASMRCWEEVFCERTARGRYELALADSPRAARLIATRAAAGRAYRGVSTGRKVRPQHLARSSGSLARRER